MELTAVNHTDGKRRIEQILAESAAAWLLAAGILLSLNELLGIGCPWEHLLLPSAVIVLLGAFVPWKYFAPLTGVLLVLLFGIALLTGENPLLNGIIGLNNCAADAVGRSTSLILPKYRLWQEASAGNDMRMAAASVSLLIGTAAFLTVRGQRVRVLVLLVLPVLALCAVLQKEPGTSGLITLAAGILTSSVCFAYRSTKDRAYGRSFEMAVQAGGVLALLAACGVSALLLFYPMDKYRVHPVVTLVQEQAQELVQRMRYEKKQDSVLPKGDFRKLGTRSASDETALEVTMSEPQSWYLRGFVGSRYTSGGWKTLDQETYYESIPLFYWLHQSGFYGNAQLTDVRAQIRNNRISDEKVTVAVKNVSADSEYLYAPYELVRDSWDQEAKREQSDEALASGELFGSRAYTYTANGNLVKDFPKLAAQRFLFAQKEEIPEYEQSESYYNAWVYEKDTQLSQPDHALLAKELGSSGSQKDGHIDYYSAIKKIRTYLEKNLTYEENCPTVPRSRDFLRWFMSGEKKGYDVHYATLATQMFRYYGIPARYVEGYLITPEDIRDSKPGDTVKIPESNGHAWTEIYVDGLGWVPIEVTPSYYDVMEQPDLTRGLQAGSASAARKPQTPPQEQLPEEEKTLPELLKETMIDLLKLLLLLLLIFDFFVLLFAAFVFIRGTASSLRRRRQFAVRENRDAVVRMIGYAGELLTYTCPALSERKRSEYRNCLAEEFTPELADAYEAAQQIGERAAFSQHLVSGAEREQVKGYMKQLRRAVWKREGRYGRWILRYMERLG